MSLPIPAAALTAHLAVLGKTGSGKSYAMRGIVEGLLDAADRVCIVDPTGAWYGLRTLADGKRAGYPVAIFGGSHADFPLAQHHGEELAEIIGTTSTPAILDVSQMRTGERTRFFTDFAEGLLRKNRGPLHLIIDEAHLFAPQGRVADPQSGAMLHAANNLISLGRSRGLRIALITQRPAKVHKDSLTQVETLVAMRLIAPQDRKAVEEWIKDNAEGDQGRAVLSSLATLKTGQGWVWAPELGVLERVQFPKIRTLDSGRAPDGSDIEGKVLASIDRDAISARLKTVAEEAKANDPKVLRARITELDGQIALLKQQPAGGTHTAADIIEARQTGERSGYARGYSMALADVAGAFESAQRVAAERFASMLRQHESAIPVMAAEQHRAAPTVTIHAQRPMKTATAAALEQMAKSVARAGRVSSGSRTAISKAERLVLTALAQYEDGRTKSQVAILTGYAQNGGGFNNAISSLRTKGWLEGSGDRLRITDTGLEALGDFTPLPHGDALLQHWMGQLSKAEKAALQTIADAYPGAISKDEVAAASGYEPNGGGFNNALSRLRTLELISGRSDALLASEALFG